MWLVVSTRTGGFLRKSALPKLSGGNNVGRMHSSSISTISFALAMVLFLSGCGTLVRVVDTSGLPVAGALVSTQRFSMGGWESAGTTNSSGKRRIWGRVPAVESVSVSKNGVGAQMPVYGKDSVTIVLGDPVFQVSQ